MRKYTYMLRTCNTDMTSYGGFVWPRKGLVTAPDWDVTDRCGGGLHGLRLGVGCGSLLSSDSDAVWVVWRALSAEVVDITAGGGGKSKAPRGWVMYAGDRDGAIAYLDAHGADTLPVDYARRTSGDSGQSTSGYGGQSTSGDRGQSTSGDWGQSTSGDWGQSTSGDSGQSTSGYRGQSTSGDSGQSTSGYRGQSTSGDSGQSTSGDWGQSSAGINGISVGLYVRAGDHGCVVSRWWNNRTNRYAWAVGIVGQGGIKADTWYIGGPNGLTECAEPEGLPWNADGTRKVPA